MAKFTSDLRVKVLENGDKFENLDTFTYYRENDKSDIISVPKGFVTNFASIPRPFWGIYPPLGAGKGLNYAKPAILHDYLYSKGTKYTRKEADAIFLESMRALKVNKFTRALFYCSVRCFGWLFYNKD